MKSQSPQPPAETSNHCKVCTKPIHRGEDHVKVYHGGAYYTVCCVSCAAKFEAAPEQYVIPH